MAFLVPYSDPKLRKPPTLKEFLLDDLSSCSSNGFRSFPRRQCCTTTVKFLLDVDLTKKKKNNYQLPITGLKTKSPSTATSALHKASAAVINAVKHVSLAAAVKKPRKAILPRSFSKNFFKRSFWKKSDRKEIERWKTFQTVVEDKSEPSSFSPSKTTAVTTAFRSSSESSGKSKKSNSSSWSDSEFTSSDSWSSGNSETVDSSKKDVVKSKRVTVIVGEDSTESTTTPSANCDADTPQKHWANEEDKEQFSPISVLDCPFNSDDSVEEEEEVSSDFKLRLTPGEGTKSKLMQKLRRFESLKLLEPVNLEKRIALSDSNHEPVGSPLQSFLDKISDNETQWDKKAEKKSAELLEQMKAKNPFLAFKFKADNLFLDFFKIGTLEDALSEPELLDIAKDWMRGQPREMLLGWEVQKNRQAYTREMERGGMWGKTSVELDKQEVVLELEAEIFSSLVNDLFLDLSNLAL